MKVFLDSIGCRLNQSEIEKLGSQFRQGGHELVDNPQDADLVVINTCTVTTRAASDSRQKIRQAGQNTRAEIIVTGCWATMEPESAAAFPGVKQIVLNHNKDEIAQQFLKNVSTEIFEQEPIYREPLPGIHARTRAFIKAQDGCNNHCTFCITRLARGQSRSQSIAEVLRDIHSAQAGGAQEVVLSGVQLGSWGQEMEPRLHLTDLIQIILAETDIARIRLSSIEPWDLNTKFFRLWEDQRLCRHFHLPLQSGAVVTLKRMARNTTSQAYRSLLQLIRTMIPDVAVNTDIMVGFPGETEQDFSESLAFVEEMQFAGGHVFPFSPRPNTAAARMQEQVPSGLSKERARLMRSVLHKSSFAFMQQFIGKEMQVLWESSNSLAANGWQLHGLTDNYIRVSAVSTELRWNQIDRVKITRLTDKGVQADILTE